MSNSVEVVTTPSAGAQLSSAVVVGDKLNASLTGYVNSTTAAKTAQAKATVTYTGTQGANRTVMIHLGDGVRESVNMLGFVLALAAGVLI